MPRKRFAGAAFFGFSGRIACGPCCRCVAGAGVCRRFSWAERRGLVSVRGVDQGCRVFSWAERWRRSGTFGRVCDATIGCRVPASFGRWKVSRRLRSVSPAGAAFSCGYPERERVNGAALRGVRSGACARSRSRRCVLRLWGRSRLCVLQLWCGSGVGLGNAFCGGGVASGFSRSCGAVASRVPARSRSVFRARASAGILCGRFSAGSILRDVFCQR